jgi:hypothetical protein
MYDGKYIRLYEFLKGQQVERITLSFNQIEELLKFKLPASAYKHRAWWANENEGRHTHARSWRNAGWKTVNPEMGRQATFIKV